MNNDDRRKERLGWWHRWYIFWPCFFVAVLALIWLAGCTSLVREYTMPPQTDRASFIVHWETSAEISRMSPGAVALTSVIPDQYGYWHIYAVLPKSFSDELNKCALGEEALHTLGAKHE